jgi:N-acetylglucosaminyl-diphospho-decaprenol L-rhamnosyltransferase
MLSIIIVSWNVRALLRACLQSLASHPCTLMPQQVIVVDNASADATVETVRPDFPDVVWVANTQNKGFTGGNNDGLEMARVAWRTQIGARLGQTPSTEPPGHYVLLLNPDTEVPAGALDELVAYAEVNKDVGLVGPQLRYPDGSIQSSRRRFPTLEVAQCESTWQPARPGLLDWFYMRDLPDDQTSDVDWVVGAAMLVPERVLDAVGPLDAETFFMYSEEIDWCKRIKQLGFRVVYHPRAVITHHEGRSSAQVSAFRMKTFNTSKVRYFRKHHGGQQAEALRAALLGQFRRQVWIERAKRALGSKPAMRSERIAAYQDVLRSGLK